MRLYTLVNILTLHLFDLLTLVVENTISESFNPEIFFHSFKGRLMRNYKQTVDRGKEDMVITHKAA